MPEGLLCLGYSHGSREGCPWGTRPASWEGMGGDDQLLHRLWDLMPLQAPQSLVVLKATVLNKTVAKHLTGLPLLYRN